MKKQPKYYAFFDVDNTIIKIKTMHSFLNYFYNVQHKPFGRFFYKKYELCRYLYRLLGANRNFLNKRYYKQYKGYHEIDIKMLCNSWFLELESTTKDLYIKSTLKKIEDHQKSGVEVVLVSGSFEECLLPMAKKFGIKYILSTHLELKKGIFTGNILSPQTIGQGKVVAIKKFLSNQKLGLINLSNCYAYGDHVSDLPMLNYVGKPHVIKGNIELESYAIRHGWPILPID